MLIGLVPARQGLGVWMKETAMVFLTDIPLEPPYLA